jgi:transposase-like protein
MHCSHCASLMAELETHQEGHTEQSRYECPICGRTQLTTKTIDQLKDSLSLQMERVSKQTLHHT